LFCRLLDENEESFFDFSLRVRYKPWVSLCRKFTLATTLCTWSPNKVAHCLMSSMGRGWGRSTWAPLSPKPLSPPQIPPSVPKWKWGFLLLSATGRSPNRGSKASSMAQNGVRFWHTPPSLVRHAILEFCIAGTWLYENGWLKCFQRA
jgi:hypothetical protein